MMVRILFCGPNRVFKSWRSWVGQWCSSGFSVSLAQALGSVSFQGFHQRTLAATSSATAQLTCFAAAFLYLLFGIPPILLGAAAASTGESDSSRWECRLQVAPPPQGHSQYLKADLKTEHVQLLIVHWISLRCIHLPPGGGGIHKDQH